MGIGVDTLDIYSRLKDAGLSEESSREIAEVFRETIEINPASKNDLKATEDILRESIEATRSEFKTQLTESIAESKVSTMMWGVAILVAQAVFIVALVKLL